MIQEPKSIKFIVPTYHTRFDALTEPTLEDITAESYLGDAIADGGQAINALDGQPNRPLTIDTNASSADWRFDLVMQRRINVNCLIIDQENLREAYPAAESIIPALKYNSVNSLTGISTAPAIKTVSGLIGESAPYISLRDDGITTSLPPSLSSGDFSIEVLFRPRDLSIAKQSLITQFDPLSLNIGYELELREDDLWLKTRGAAANSENLIASAIGSNNQLIWIWVDVDRSTGITAHIKLDDDPIQSYPQISQATNYSISSSDDLIICDSSDNSTPLDGEIYHAILYDILSAAIDLDQVAAGYLPGSGILIHFGGDGINKTNSIWRDSQSSFNNGAIPSSADYGNVPDDDNLGFLLMEIDPVDERYWFSFFNEVARTGNALIKSRIGQTALAKMYEFNGLVISEGYSGNNNYPGNMITKTVTGVTQAEEQSDRENDWSLSFAISNQADFDDMQEMLKLIKGNLYSFYVSFDYDSPNPTLFRVRLSSPALPFGYRGFQSSPWGNLSLELVEDL